MTTVTIPGIPSLRNRLLGSGGGQTIRAEELIIRLWKNYDALWLCTRIPRLSVKGFVSRHGKQ